MRLLFILLAAAALTSCGAAPRTLTYTTPLLNAASPDSCVGMPADTARDLRFGELQYRPLGGTWIRWTTHNIPSRGGVPDSFVINMNPLSDGSYEFRVFAVDSSGNSSCPGNVVSIAWTRRPAPITTTQVKP